MGDMMRNYRGGSLSRATLANETRPNNSNNNGTRPIERPEATNCQRLKRKLQTVDFAIVDTVLYLNAYPDCRRALEHYHKLIAEREVLVATINEKCGPICHRDNKSRTEWNWIQGPWPWESDAN